MDYVTQIIDPPPSRTQLLLDGVRALRKPKLEGAPLLPRECLVRSAVALSASAIAAYGHACGFRREQGVPLSYPHVLAFPLQQRGRVGRGDVQRQGRTVDTGSGLLQRCMGLGHIHTHHVGAVAGQHLGDGQTNPTRRAGDQCAAPNKRLIPVDGNLAIHRFLQAHDLPGHIGRTARQKKPQAAVQGVFGARRDVDQLHGDRPAQFLGRAPRRGLLGRRGDARAAAAPDRKSVV